MLAFVSIDIAEQFKMKTGIEVLPLKPYNKLDKPVSSHADMLINIIEDRIFCYEDYYLENKDIFDKAEKEGYSIVKCTSPASSEYPNDIGLNCLIIGKSIFGRINHLSSELLKFANERSYKLIDVKQGYSACSTLVLNERCVVTADPSIKKAVEKHEIEVIYIDDSSIKIDGYDHGFIGGATAVVCDNICFFGDPTPFEWYKNIHSKIALLEMKEILIMSGDVYDFGGIKLLNKQ
jgi:hypothetical protein